ncbi:aldolase/citrate lyase family protein [Megamonas sp.]
MKLNKMRNILDNNKSSVNTRIWSTWPTVVEAAASTGNFDYFEFVAEYAPFTLKDLENFARTCELYNVGSMIKVDFQNRFYVAQKAVGCGFQAVLFTDHETPDDVRETLKMVTPKTPQDGGKFGYPNGRWIGYHPELKQMDYAAMNRSFVKAFMIEKKEAMDNIEEICSIPGVDMVQFGPSDYCMSLGWNCADHQEEIKEAQEKMIKVALAHNVQPRVEIATLEQAEYYKKLGVRHFCILDQMDILMNAWLGVCGDVKKLAQTIK